MTSVTPQLVQEVCHQFSQDGLAFQLLTIDGAARRVEISLDVTDVECADCVMPSTYLERLISSSLSNRAKARVEVKLHDPRAQTSVDEISAASLSGASVGSRVVVLDPTASGRTGDASSGPDAGPLIGRTVLFRTDVLWESWDWIVDEWSCMLEKAGVKVAKWRRSQGSWGAEADRRQAEFESLIRSSAALVSGLGNCGSCSVSTVNDALSGLRSSTPTLTAVTSHFYGLARTLAEDSGHPGLRIMELPHPLSQRPESEIRQIAREHFPRMLLELGARL